MKILEKRYRGSLICRVMGYPITYAIAKLLLEQGPLDLKNITAQVGRAKNTVCGHLSKLKLAHLIRYEKKGGKTIYWIKYQDELREFMNICEKLVKRISRRIEHDY